MTYIIETLSKENIVTHPANTQGFGLAANLEVDKAQ